LKDRKNGSGKYWYANGDRYEGEWKNDSKHGYGKISNFLKISTDILGTYKWRDGREYEGHFSNNLREGYGNFYFPNGVKFSGEWKEDLREGRGVLTNVNGVTLTGTWIKDSLHGKVIRKLKKPDENGKMTFTERWEWGDNRGAYKSSNNLFYKRIDLKLL
jgi:hypothetical protein